MRYLGPSPDRALYIHNEDQDGKLSMVIKFGRVFMIKTPAVDSMLLEDFIKVLPKQEKRMETSFYELSASYEDIATILKASGFVQKDEPVESVSIKVVHTKKPYVFYNITMDKDFNFKFLCPRNRKFFDVDISSADPNTADVRAQVFSIDKYDKPSDAVGPGEKYMVDKLVTWDDEHDPIIQPGMEEKVTYASIRKETTYSTNNPRAFDTVFQKNVEVRILEAAHYDKPKDGQFTRKETRCEVFMHIT